MKKVILFVPDGIGGAEKVSTIYAKILKKAGFNVTIVLIRINGVDRGICHYIPSDIDTRVISCTRGYKAFPDIARIVREEHPDYVFSAFTSISAILILLSFKYKSVKVVARQCFTPGTESRSVEYLIRVLFRYAFINIAQTEEMRNEMILRYKINPEKCITINNPLDVDDIANKIKGLIVDSSVKYNYLAVGRLHPIKGYMTLLKAFRKVAQQQPQAKLTIIGGKRDEEYYGILMDYIKDNFSLSQIQLVDFTDNPYKYLIETDCFVLSSLKEGLPNVLLEALYLNVPVVATKCLPFVSQNITDGINGYVVDVEDWKYMSECMLRAVYLKGHINNDRYNDLNTKHIIDVFSA